MTVIGIYEPIREICARSDDAFNCCRKQLSYKRPNFWKVPDVVLCRSNSVKEKKKVCECVGWKMDQLVSDKHTLHQIINPFLCTSYRFQTVFRRTTEIFEIFTRIYFPIGSRLYANRCRSTCSRITFGCRRTCRQTIEIILWIAIFR